MLTLILVGQIILSIFKLKLIIMHCILISIDIRDLAPLYNARTFARFKVHKGGNAELGENSTLTISCVRKGSMACDRICQ